MPATINQNDKKTYDKLVQRFPLRPIRMDEENDKAAEIFDELTSRMNRLSQAERDYLEVLTDLIAKFESRWEKEVADMSPRELIQYLMEQNDLAQTDLVSEFGSASRVSEFLNGKRNLSIEQAKKVSSRFKLQLSALLED